MTITRVIHGETVEIELTEIELIRAFEEQQHLNDISAVAYHIETDYEDIAPVVYERLHSDDAIMRIVEEAREQADYRDIDFRAAVDHVTEDYANDIADDLGLPSIYEEEDEE